MDSNQTVELRSKDSHADQDGLLELIDLELAFVGGGSGDVIIK